MTPDMRLAAYRAAAVEKMVGKPRPDRLRITSHEISDRVAVNPTQVRRDLIPLPLNGKRGTGYLAYEIVAAIDRELRPRLAQLDAEITVQVGVLRLIYNHPLRTNGGPT